MPSRFRAHAYRVDYGQRFSQSECRTTLKILLM